MIRSPWGRQATLQTCLRPTGPKNNERTKMVFPKLLSRNIAMRPTLGQGFIAHPLG